MIPSRTGGLKQKIVLVWCMFGSCFILLLSQRKFGLAGISHQSTASYAAITWSNRTAWPLPSPPCGHGLDKIKRQIPGIHDLKMKRVANFTLDTDYINNHWAESLDAIPLAHANLVHVHHVCVSGGEGGLVVPHLGGLLNAIGYMDRRYYPESSYPIAFREFTFEELLGLFGTTADQRKHNVTRVTATMVPGSSYFMNCWSRSRGDTNPSHWLMKIHKLFELAEVMRGAGPASLPPFNNLVFHQCASYDRVVRQGLWAWGKIVFEAATRRWSDVGLWQGPDQIRVIELNKPDQDWICFEDLVFETQYGTWFPASQYIPEWRHSLLESVGLSDDNSVSDVGLAKRCGSNRLRIHVFKRTEGRGLREFVNLDEVVALAENYTSLPIEVVTIDSTTPVQAQAAIFGGFDLLITSHGSQLANLIFTDPERAGVIEVLPVVRDRTFWNNARDAGFLSYTISTGHAPFPVSAADANLDNVCLNGSEIMKQKCWREPHTDIWECSNEWKSTLTSCNTFINIAILRKHIKTAMTELCAS